MQTPSLALDHRRLLIQIALVIAALLRITAWGEGGSHTTTPNIIFILADDLGWRDVGFNGSHFYETPHLDKLAGDGIQFTNAYTNAANCAPTRASILTGQFPQRTGILTVKESDRGDKKAQKLIPVPNKMVLDTATFSMAEGMHLAGYHTAFIGKWHLGDHLETSPLAHGFDFSLGGWERGSPISYFSPYQNPALSDGEKGEHLTDRLTNEAIGYLDSRMDKEAPFFLYLSYYAVHSPYQGKESVVTKFEKKEAVDDQDNAVYAAMIETLDDNIGRLTEFLKVSGLIENTIVVFYSDNGGSFQATVNTPLKGSKGMLYEGGIRVPCIVHAPSIYPVSKSIDNPIISTDLFPTFLDWAGIDNLSQHPLDGESIKPLIESQAVDDRPLFWYAPVYLPIDNSNYAFRNTPGAAIRKGKFKLIWRFEEEMAELYNLEDDISENKNLATTHPEIYRDLLNELKTWLHDTNAEICTDPNPLFDAQHVQETYERIRY